MLLRVRSVDDRPWGCAWKSLLSCTHPNDPLFFAGAMWSSPISFLQQLLFTFLWCFLSFLSINTMLNYSVYCRTVRRSIVPWNIATVEPPDTTFRKFFSENVLPKIQEPNRELKETFVGKSKDMLDCVDKDMCVREVITTFGPYAKFVTEEIGAIGPVAGSLFCFFF